MDITQIEILGLFAAVVTSAGFLPQLVRGYKTKKLDDISYFFPAVLAIGMFLWLIYGILLGAIAVIVANTYGVSCNILLLIMKKVYS
jgi:MtN3 and saliva related transmembrane protein